MDTLTKIKKFFIFEKDNIKRKGMHNHECFCGTSRKRRHIISENGCKRFMTLSPIKHGDRWFVDGSYCTDYALRQQRGYHQHECGCWSRWEGSMNSLEWD